MHALWLEAGGGTQQYDAERYLGLLRDHGWARPRVGLTEILASALHACRLAAEDPETLVGALAPILTDELGKHGYRIHDVVRCVRVVDPLTVGRPMTPEEEAAVSIQKPVSQKPAQVPGAAAAEGVGDAAAPVADHRELFAHVTPEGDRFLVPDGWTPGDRSSHCRSCNALILWCTTARGKRSPTNPNGSSHFSDCPDAAGWKRKSGGDA